MVDDPQEEFDGLYTKFIEAGGFKLPALAEDWERDARDMDKPRHQRTICPHGKPLLVCEICYFRPNNGWS